MPLLPKSLFFAFSALRAILLKFPKIDDFLQAPVKASMKHYWMINFMNFMKIRKIHFLQKWPFLHFLKNAFFSHFSWFLRLDTSLRAFLIHFWEASGRSSPFASRDLSPLPALKWIASSKYLPSTTPPKGPKKALFLGVLRPDFDRFRWFQGPLSPGCHFGQHKRSFSASV